MKFEGGGGFYYIFNKTKCSFLNKIKSQKQRTDKLRDKQRESEREFKGEKNE